MTRAKTAVLCTVLLLAALPTTAVAWGPVAERAIVGSAAQVVSRENNVPLNRLLGYIREGAAASDERLAELVPDADRDLQRAIESQIYLLQAVRGERVDPYFAYRLGVLGKLVARYTSPLDTAEARYRDAYAQDADQAIGSIRLSTSPRRTVDPSVYLPEARREAQARRDLIVQDYQTGAGFQGVGRSSLPREASRSVDTVADVWYSVLSAGTAVGGASQEQVRNYHLDALRYYLSEHVNANEAAATYKRLMASGEVPMDVRKRIGDLFYDAGNYNRAMEEYRAILEQEPGRRDVMARVAEYYMSVGDRARQVQNLEGALDAYRQARDVDPVNADAQSRLRETENLIAARNSRLDEARAALAEAQALQQQAQRLESQRNFGGAMDALQQARGYYASVPEEFMTESQEASRGLTSIDVKLRQLQVQLVQDTGQLSGTGFPIEARRLAAGKVQGVEDEALKRLMDQGYRSTIEDYTREMERALVGAGGAR